MPDFIEAQEFDKPRVTFITNVLKIYALQPWASKTAAESYHRELKIEVNALRAGLQSIKDFVGINWDKIRDLAKGEYKKVSKEATGIGSRVHAAIDLYIQALDAGTGEISVDTDIEKPFGAFLKWWDENDIEVIASEQRVESEDGGGYKGQFDMVCHKGKERTIYIIDFKASNGFYEPDYPLQLAAYRNAFVQQYEKEIDGMAILRLDKQSGEPFWKEYEHYEDYRAAFIRLTEYVHCIENIKSMRKK